LSPKQARTQRGCSPPGARPEEIAEPSYSNLWEMSRPSQDYFPVPLAKSAETAI
jgi:hypothetical protein